MCWVKWNIYVSDAHSKRNLHSTPWQFPGYKLANVWACLTSTHLVRVPVVTWLWPALKLTSNVGGINLCSGRGHKEGYNTRTLSWNFSLVIWVTRQYSQSQTESRVSPWNWLNSRHNGYTKGPQPPGEWVSIHDGQTDWTISMPSALL
jgi:hypothetical protein